MMPHAVILSELERDALTELVNIGVSRAATALRAMIGRQVLLSVPSIEIVAQGDAALLISEREAGELVAIKQDFAGAFSGRALLIFPAQHGLELARAAMGGEVGEPEALEFEQEALAEIGNVILNNCLGTMANILHQTLTMTLPIVFRSCGAELFRLDSPAAQGGLVLFLYINFSVFERNISGYIAMVLDMPSLSVLQSLIREFISSVMGDLGEAT